MCPEVLHDVEIEMRGLQVSVDGYNNYAKLSNMTLTVHHFAKIHQWCRKPIKRELKYDLGKHAVTGSGLKACSTSQA